MRWRQRQRLTDDGVEEGQDETVASDVQDQVEREVVLIFDDQIRITAERIVSGRT